MLSQGELIFVYLKLLCLFSFLGNNSSIVLWETMLLQVRVGPALTTNEQPGKCESSRTIDDGG